MKIETIIIVQGEKRLIYKIVRGKNGTIKRWIKDNSFFSRGKFIKKGGL